MGTFKVTFVKAAINLAGNFLTNKYQFYHTVIGAI